MTNEEHLETAIAAATGSADEDFDVYLPVNSAMDEQGATHVAHMHGDEATFREVLAGFVATGSDLSAPLRNPISESGNDDVHRALAGLGSAEVVSVDPLDPTHLGTGGVGDNG